MLFSWLTRKPVKARPSGRETATGNYHAVELQPGQAACEFVRSFKDRRLLSQDAPKLPLAACCCTPCNCRYVHFFDRRCGDERRDHFINVDTSALVRRARRDRRASSG